MQGEFNNLHTGFTSYTMYINYRKGSLKIERKKKSNGDNQKTHSYCCKTS